MEKKFIPTNYGWISTKTPPQNSNNVVILVYDNIEELYIEFIGYHENGRWEFIENENTQFIICGWFPIPFIPNND